MEESVSFAATQFPLRGPRMSRDFLPEKLFQMHLYFDSLMPHP